MDIILFIAQSFVILLSFVVGILVRELPTWLREKNLEKTRLEHAIELQRENYFRELSGKKIHDIFDEWIGLLFDTENQLKQIERKGGFKKVCKDAVMYGSTETIKIISTIQGYIHGNQKEVDEKIEEELENSEKVSLYTVKLMCLLSLCIKSLKFDFTGYEIDNEDLFKMYLSGFEYLKKHNLYKRANKEVDTLLKRK